MSRLVSNCSSWESNLGLFNIARSANHYAREATKETRIALNLPFGPFSAAHGSLLADNYEELKILPRKRLHLSDRWHGGQLRFILACRRGRAQHYALKVPPKRLAKLQTHDGDAWAGVVGVEGCTEGTVGCWKAIMGDLEMLRCSGALEWF